MSDHQLTEEEKERILEEFKKDPDLKRITQVISGDPNADGRSKIGRAIRSYLSSLNKTYKTTKVEETGSVTLTQQQEKFLMSDQIDLELNPLEIARIVFDDETIKSLSAHHRTIIDFLKEKRPDVINENEIVTSEKWISPHSVVQAVKRVNVLANQELSASSLSNKQEKMMKALIFNMNTPRLEQTINSFSRVGDRQLFESEFIRATWDKIDLSPDEVNLYIALCQNYVRIKHTQSRLDKLNRMLEDSDDEKYAMSMVDLIKTTSEELNQCEKRIEALTKNLNGSRQDRIKARGQRNGTIEALVEAFQDKEERDRMIKMAQMRQKLVKDQADELETMSEFKARVLGISKEELL